jgi:hypothetical protein
MHYIRILGLYICLNSLLPDVVIVHVNVWFRSLGLGRMI